MLDLCELKQITENTNGHFDVECFGFDPPKHSLAVSGSDGF